MIKNDIDDKLYRLSKSKFRSSFSLTLSDKLYVEQKGLDVIKGHAHDFITKRIAPDFPKNDGKQTPFKGHPIFIAQHACACCCRSCIEKWHGIPKGRKLTSSEVEYIVNILIRWIEEEIRKEN